MSCFWYFLHPLLCLLMEASSSCVSTEVELNMKYLEQQKTLCLEPWQDG